MVGEILDGELFASPRPAPAHSSAEGAIITDVSGPFKRKPGDSGGPGGWWILVEPELHLGADVLVPDVAGWRRERMPAMPKTAWFDLAPDWVCEVVSPATGRLDRVRKMPKYAASGVAFIWLVDPLLKTLEAYRLESSRWLLLGTWGGEVTARVGPFEAVEMDLARWWEGIE
jgi:Uma2 family endonuclease